MHSKPQSSPGYVVVTSPMRTGSTWLVGLLKGIAAVPDRYVTNAEQVRASMDELKEGAILKTHSIIDLDWPQLPHELSIVRVIRNYKDSLVSRALYVRNIRTREGRGIDEPEIRSLLTELGDASDLEFVRAFVDRCSLVEDWLAEMAVLERGEDERCVTLMYETLMHNPYDALAELTTVLWPGCSEAMSRVTGVVRRSIQEGFNQRDSFLRSRAVGVGGWETLLSWEQSERLDEIYFKMRSIATHHPDSRRHQVLEMYHKSRQGLKATKRKESVDATIRIHISKRDRVPIFCGGIGDVFLQCCITDRYRILEDKDGPEVVVNASRNEYAWELFAWHPRADRFQVVNAVQPPSTSWSKREFLEILGLKGDRLYVGSGKQIDWSTRFYPSAKDLNTLSLFDRKNFGIFAPFSKKQKTFSAELSKLVLATIHDWRRSDYDLLGIGRNYQGVNERSQNLKDFADNGWLVNMSSFDLSVPGSFELARKAAFYIGANSCLALIMMSLGRPTVIIEPENHPNPESWSRLFDLKKCLLVQKFNTVDPVEIITFLDRNL
jgi:hypothetical protein